MAFKDCTFWFPTIYQKEISLLPIYDKVDRPMVDDDISDEDFSHPYHLKIEHDKAGNLYVTSILNGKYGTDSEFTIKLEKKEHSLDGFVRYCFDTEEIKVPKDKYDAFEKNVICRDIYHLSKRFYHEHEINESKDCTLEAFVSSSTAGDGKTLDKENHKYLIDILSRFHDAFQSYARHISERNKENRASELRIEKLEKALEAGTCKRKKQAQGWENIEKEQQLLKDNLRKVSRFCENALMEYTYYKTLYHSPYNNLFICESVDGKKDEKYSRMALNVENTMRYIKAVQIQTQNAYNRMLHRKQTESKWLIQQIHRTEKSSGAVALLSIVLAIGLSSNDVWLKIFPNIPECSLDIGKQCFLLIGIIGVLLLLFVSKK